MTAEAIDLALLALQIATLVLVVYGAYLAFTGLAWRDETGMKTGCYEATQPGARVEEARAAGSADESAG